MADNALTINTDINPKFREDPVDVFPEPVAAPGQFSNSEFIADFLGMEIEEQRKYLGSRNTDFSQMEAIEQTRFLNNMKEDTINMISLFGEGGVPPDATEYTTAQQVYLNIKPYAKPAAEIGALTAGSLVAAPLGPLAMVGSAGLSYAMVQNLFKMAEGMLGLREPQGILKEAQLAVRDTQEGMLFEGGGQLIKPLVSGALAPVKKAFKGIAKRSTLTDVGARTRADKIIKQEIKGTEITQPQIDRNIKEAKELEALIRKEVDSKFTFTFGQLTDDGSAVALERVLGRKGGVDLTQSQRQSAVESLRTYYNKKLLSTGTVEDFVQYAERMSKELDASTVKATRAVDAEVARLNRHVEPQVYGTVIHKNLSAGKAVAREEATVLYDKIPNIKLETAKLSDDIKSFVVSEDKLMEPRTKQMISLINSKILKSVKGEAVKTINPATSEVTITQPTETIQTGYQVLRKLHSKVAKNLRAASNNPEQLEDARQLFELRKFLDSAMDQMKKTKPLVAKAYEKATRFYRDDYIPTYRQGTVADVLRKGARGEETRIAKASIAQSFDSLDGIDHLVKAAGRQQASTMMKDYYAYDLVNFAVDVEGKVSAKKAATWALKNKFKLKKLGLVDDFKSLEAKQRIVDEAIGKVNVFNKSILGKVLNVDVESVMIDAYSNTKTIVKTTNELLAKVKGNPAAEKGLKKAFAEFLFKKVESSIPGFLQAAGGTTSGDIEFLKSMGKMNTVFRQFRPAMNIMYKDEPKKFQALMDVWQGLRILERTAQSPIGAGSPTAELIFGERAIARTGAAALGGVRPGWLYPFIFVNKWIEKHGQAKVEAYLTKALFDPEYAAILTQISKKGETKATSVVIKRLMRNVSLVAGKDIGNEESVSEKRSSAGGINPPVQ